MLNTVT